MGSKLVLLGGGHVHMYTMAQVAELVGAGHEVLLIAPSPYHYYSGMAPGALGGVYRPEDVRFDIRSIIEGGGGRFLQGRVASIDGDARQVQLESGERVGYDVLSCNLGSKVVTDRIDIRGGHWYPVKPVEKVIQAREKLVAVLAGGPATAAVVGGGPGSVEMAGNLWRIARDEFGDPGRLRIKLFSSAPLLERFPERMRIRASKSLLRRGVEIHTGVRVSQIEEGALTLDDGSTHEVDVTLLSTGIKPPTIFRDSGFPVADDGGMLVNQHLQSIRDPEVFGGGDCIRYQPQTLDRVGVYAVRQNRPLYRNLKAALDGEWDRLEEFDPGGGYLLALNMGDDTALVKKYGIVFGGKLGFRLKDYLDRSFMKQFQVPERSEEPIES